MKQIAHRSPWRSTSPPSLSPLQKAWLMRPGALTMGLRQLGRLELRVLREFSTGATLDEAKDMHLRVRSPVWIREVAMRINGIDCVVARSLTPLRASHSVWQAMRTLRSRPLMDILYQDRAIKRTGFNVARVTRLLPMMQPISQLKKNSTQGLLARRSVFWRAQAPLMVAECFLPAFWDIAFKNQPPGRPCGCRSQQHSHLRSPLTVAR
jgi:chorismate--pyruvate lyase